MTAQVTAATTRSIPPSSIAGGTDGAAPASVTPHRLVMVHVPRRTAAQAAAWAAVQGHDRHAVLSGLATGVLLLAARSPSLLRTLAPKRLPAWSGLPLALALPPAVSTRLTTLAAARGMDVRHLAGWLVERALQGERPPAPSKAERPTKLPPVSAAEALWLRRERQRLRISGRRLAQRVGCARSTIAAYEAGYRRTAATAARIRDVLRTWPAQEA